MKLIAWTGVFVPLAVEPAVETESAVRFSVRPWRMRLGTDSLNVADRLAMEQDSAYKAIVHWFRV